MEILGDGTIIASYMSVGSTPKHAVDSRTSNYVLRGGEVIHVNPPTQKSKFVTYDVEIQSADGVPPYKNVHLLSDLCGFADKSRFVLRARSSVESEEAVKGGFGSKVLLLCVEGQQQNAIILGGIRDDKDDDLDLKLGPDGKPALFYQWTYNGIDVQINDLGELICTYTGKTDAKDAHSAQSGAAGTFVKLLEDGSVHVKTSTNELKLDQPAGQITIKTSNNVTIDSSGTVDLKAASTVNVTAGAALTIAATGGISMSGFGSGGGGGGSDGSAIKLGKGNEQLIKGSTYRKSQKLLHNELRSALKSASSQLETAGTNLVALPAIAAAALTAAGAALSQAAQSLERFESAEETYLSKNNKAD